MQTFTGGDVGGNGGVPAFLAKLWRLVEDPETNHMIYWSRDGRSFVIQNQAQFAHDLLPLNYKHNNMASFIRQLNMYGFHKITSIDNGGLKFDRDDMEFSHPCFKRDHPYLLEHIKRKIANPKGAIVVDDKAALKPETVTKVLSEVKMMRGRQDSLDSRFSAMKSENEALWREIAMLRQKHMKQQQIVNKLIQFLVTIVQPSRNMSGVKRHVQLMINDVPQQPSNRSSRKINQTDSGPIIRELGEELLEEAADSETELNANSPVILSPSAGDEFGTMSGPPSLERPRSNSNSSAKHDSNQSGGSASTSTSGGVSINSSGSRKGGADDDQFVIYHINEVGENGDFVNHYGKDNDNVLTPLVKKEIARSNLKARKRKWQEVTSQQKQLPPQPHRKTATTSFKIKDEKDLDELIFLSNNQMVTARNDSESEINSLIDNRQDNENGQQESENVQGDGTAQLYADKENFISTEIPTDLFEDSPMLSDINLTSDNYNPSIGFKGQEQKQEQQQQKQSSQQFNVTLSSNNESVDNDNDSCPSAAMALTKYNSSKIPNHEEILRLSSADEVHNHLENFQGDLDNLKELLRSEANYSLDANTLMGNSPSVGNRIVFSPSLDGDLLAKLFNDSDVLSPFGLNLTDSEQGSSQKGSELMTYQPYYADLSDILDMEDSEALRHEAGNEQDQSTSRPLDSVLNTPTTRSDAY